MANILQRGDSYRIKVSMGRDVNGKQILKYANFTPDASLTPKKKQKAVEAFAAEFEKKCLNGQLLEGEKTTLKEFIERWESERATQELQAKTLEQYRIIIQEHILPRLGHMKLSDLKPHTINGFFVSLTKDGCRCDGKPGGYSKGTVNKVSNVLSSILRTAVEWEVIDRNPCEKVRVKAEDAADKVKFFTPEQTNVFLDYISKPFTVKISGHGRTDDTGKPYKVKDYTTTKEIPLQLQVMFTLAIYTGLRNGELLALTWDDIDFENGTIAVTKAATVVDGVQMTKEPKTKKSYRLVSIPESMTATLKKLRNEQTRYRLQVGSFWQGENWVFTQANGKMMSYSTPSASLRDIIRRYNADKEDADKLPVISIHALRHTSATLLIAAHTDAKTVSARLGHAETSTTLNIYAHSLIEADKVAADKLEEIIAKQA